MRRSSVCLLATLSCFLSAQSLAQTAIIGADRADAVVVGRITAGVDLVDGVTFSLAVVRSVHGEPRPGQVLAVDAKLQLRRNMSPKREVQGQCGLFVLRRTQSAWEVLGSGNSPFLSSLYAPLGDCEASGAELGGDLSAYEKSILEIVFNAERDSSIARRVNLFSLTAKSDSVVVRDLMHRLSMSTSPQLRVYGLAWRTAEGDAAAVTELCNLSAQPSDEPLKLAAFSSAILEYADTDGDAVMALGEFLDNSDVDNVYLRRGVAHALRNIHTVEAVPFLARMLDSPDLDIRTEAVSGLTEYSLGIRAAAGSRDKAAAIDEVLNPGRNPAAPNLAEQDHFHIGPFTDPGQEPRLLMYWKQWWEQHRLEFEVPVP